MLSFLPAHFPSQIQHHFCLYLFAPAADIHSVLTYSPSANFTHYHFSPPWLSSPEGKLSSKNAELAENQKD
jgi:hypothetical protein